MGERQRQERLVARDRRPIAGGNRHGTGALAVAHPRSQRPEID
jgi:hypothetical protein